MKKKASMELSINFIVMVILSLAMLGLGILILTKIIGDTKDLVIPTEVEDEILHVFKTSGSSVAIPKIKININRNEHANLYYGIKNVTSEDEFKVSTIFNKAYNNQNQQISPTHFPKFTHLNGDHTLVEIDNSRGFTIQPLFISVSKDVIPGTYQYFLEVNTADDEIYDTKKVFIIKVI
ncbi:MAG: hypothetical protein ACLFPJ_02855 [Candidatus Woesearchaeota archaeon]